MNQAFKNSWWKRLRQRLGFPSAGGKTANRTPRRPIHKFEHFESREMLSATSMSPADSQAIFAQDATTGDWFISRFDGENFVQENLEFNAGVGDWQEPLAADLDGDGIQSLIVRDASTGNWWQFGNTWDPSAASIIGNWSLASTYGDFHVVDMTGDGRDDIIGRSADGNWWALAHNGSWVSNLWIAWSDPNIAWQETYVLDIDGNGRTDLVSRDANSGNWHVIWHKDGGFRRDIIGNWNPGNTYSDFLVADMDGDGASELVGQANYGGWWSIGKTATGYGNTALGYWNPQHDWQHVTTADLNGDGRSEILGRVSTTGNWHSISLQGTTVLNSVVAWWNPQYSYSSVKAFDLDGDGLDELVGLASYGHWWLSEFQSGQMLNVSIGACISRDSHYSQIADVDGNGTLDLVNVDWANRLTTVRATAGGFSVDSIAALSGEDSPASLLALENASTGRSAMMVWSSLLGLWSRIEYPANALTKSDAVRLVESVPNYSSAESIDIDGDRASDLVRFEASTGRWFAAISDGDQLQEKHLATWNTQAVWQQFLYGDIDGNGSTDIVARDEMTGDWWAIRFVSSSFVSERISSWNPFYDYGSLTLADLDGDNQKEIIGLASYGGWWAIDFFSNRFGNVALDYWGSGNWQALPPADMDGDGDDEIVGFDPISARWLVANYDAGINSTRVLATWNAAVSYLDLQTIDFDGDGVREVIGRASSTGEWRRAFLSGTQVVDETIATWNAATDWRNLSVGNFDGDSGDELIGQDGSDGAWYWLKYENGQVLTEAIGNTGVLDRVWVGDLDADGYDELNYIGPADGVAYSASIEQGTLVDLAAAPWTAGMVPAEVHFGSAPGFSDATLKASLLNEIVGLREALATDPLAAAELLLQWTSNAANYALTQSVMIPSEQRVAGASAAQAYYEEFSTLLSACYCSGITTFYVRVLHLFDIPGIRYDFGTVDMAISHSTVVVPTWDGAKWQYHLFDPTFNATFYNTSTGDRVELLEMMDAVNADSPLNASWQTGDFSGRNWISDSPTSNPSYTFRQSTGNRFVYGNPDYSLQTYLTNFTPDFVSNGLTPDLTGFVRLMGTHVFLSPSQTYPELVNYLVGELQSRGISIN